MQDIIDFINGVPRRISKEELEALVQMGVKPMSRDGLATCVLQELGDERLGQKVFDDTSFDAVIANNTGTQVMFVTCEAPIPLYDTYCGDAVAIALREKYGVDETFRSIINIATGYDGHDLERAKGRVEGKEERKTALEKLLQFWDIEMHPPYWHSRTTEESVQRIVVDTFHISGLPNMRLGIPPKERLQSDEEFYQLVFEAYREHITTQSGQSFATVKERIPLQPWNWESQYSCGEKVTIHFEVDSDKHYVEIKVHAPEGETLQERIARLTEDFMQGLKLKQVDPPRPFGY